MKQRITLNQFDSLSRKAKGRLNDWVLNSEGVLAAFPEGDYDIDCTLLNIGQMIEFLLNEAGFNLDYSDSDNTWGVMLGEFEFGRAELCDALWEAVKEVLETK